MDHKNNMTQVKQIDKNVLRECKICYYVKSKKEFERIYYEIYGWSGSIAFEDIDTLVCKDCFARLIEKGGKEYAIKFTKKLMNKFLI